MAIEDCEPCNCVPGNIQDAKFKQDVEVILCAILAASGGGGGLSATLEPQVATDFTAVGAAYVSLGFVDGLKEFYVSNTTDVNIEFQFGASTGTIVHLTVRSNSEREKIFNPLIAPGPVYMRYSAATGAPTFGAVRVEGFV